MVFDLGIWCFSGFAALFPIVFAAVYWRRVTESGAIAATLVTAGAWSVLFYRDMLADKPPGADELLILGMLPVATLFLISSVTLVLVSLVTRPPSDETVEKFFPRREG